MAGNLAHLGAELIVQDFDRYREQFKAITRRARHRFSERDWQGMRTDAMARLSLYKEVQSRTADTFRGALGERAGDRDVWADMKTAFSAQIHHRRDWELAETWFNSLSRRMLSTIGVDPHIEFSRPEKQFPSPRLGPAVYRTYTDATLSASFFGDILKAYLDQVPFADLKRDARLISECVDAHLARIGSLGIDHRVEMLDRAFFRGMGAYLVGRLTSGSRLMPLILAVMHGPRGVFTDAALLSQKDASILFSFTRSSFHVDIDRPYELVRFLKSILPKKKIAEIYMAIGHHKHGKTELFRDLQEHLSVCFGEQFEMAPGQRGMVMEVFGMSNYDIVFKLIKDRFAYPKTSTRREVIAKYELVFMHDRAGRLVEAQPFEHLTFDPCCFSDTLLAELTQSAPRTVHADAERISIDHAYVQRRVIPLDIYLKAADRITARAAVVDFGNAIKDLAKSNIFPGDFLLKNFGVTRHGRVVFYDYDELCLLTECRFRNKPQARTDDDEFSGEPWYYIGDNDVFPEEFASFLGFDRHLMAVFLDHHADLFRVDFWQETQQAILAGRWCHIFPYPSERRFDQPRDSICEFWDTGCR